MALFESYERREKQILAVLKEYGIDSIEGAAEVTKAAGLDVYKMVEGMQSGLTLLVQPSQSKRDVAVQQMQPLQSEKACRHSAFRVLLQTREK